MVSMRWRVAVVAVVTAASLLTLFLWPAEWLRYRSFGMPMDLALTWWGPALLLLIPATLCWASYGASDRRGFRIGMAMTAILLGSFALIVWYVNDFVQPWCGFWQGCISNWSLQNY